MSMTDPIADLLTRIRNANMAHRDVVEIPASKIKMSIVEILKSEGFVRDDKEARSKQVGREVIAYVW